MADFPISVAGSVAAEGQVTQNYRVANPTQSPRMPRD